MRCAASTLHRGSERAVPRSSLHALETGGELWLVGGAYYGRTRRRPGETRWEGSLFFDEIADFLAKGANSDVEELKDEARADLESFARLGRAIQVNIIAAEQNPEAKTISTRLRSQLGFRLGVDPTTRSRSGDLLLG